MIFFLKLLIALLMILFLIDYLDFNKIITAAETADYSLLIAGFLLTGVNIYLQYSKWRIICRETLMVSDRKEVFYSLFYGFSAGIATPSRLGEYVGRALPFKNNTALEVTSATLLDKIIPLFISILCGFFFTILFIHHIYAAEIYITVSMFIALALLAYFSFQLITNKEIWELMFISKIKKIKFFQKHSGIFSVLKNVDKLLIKKIFTISLIFYFTYILQFALLISAFTHESDFHLYIWGGILLMFSKSFIPQLTFGELGIREGASIFFLTSLGVSEIAAFNASIFLFLMNLVLPSTLGLILLLRRN